MNIILLIIHIIPMNSHFYWEYSKNTITSSCYINIITEIIEMYKKNSKKEKKQKSYRFLIT